MLLCERKRRHGRIPVLVKSAILPKTKQRSTCFLTKKGRQLVKENRRAPSRSGHVDREPFFDDAIGKGAFVTAVVASPRGRTSQNQVPEGRTDRAGVLRYRYGKSVHVGRGGRVEEARSGICGKERDIDFWRTFETDAAGRRLSVAGDFAMRLLRNDSAKEKETRCGIYRNLRAWYF